MFTHAGRMRLRGKAQRHEIVCARPGHRRDRDDIEVDAFSGHQANPRQATVRRLNLRDLSGDDTDAAGGEFVGYLLPTENVMQIVGVTLMLLSLAGGLFIPLEAFSPAVRTAAAFTPLWGLNGLVHYPLGISFDWRWVANLAAWTAIFTGGAAWRFSIDTERV